MYTIPDLRYENVCRVLTTPWPTGFIEIQTPKGDFMGMSMNDKVQWHHQGTNLFEDVESSEVCVESFIRYLEWLVAQEVEVKWCRAVIRIWNKK